jgi:hypothetical protein
MKKKTTKLRNINTRVPYRSRFLITEEALRGAMREEFALYLRMGEMIEHFGPKMPMLNRVLSPEQEMNPCLDAFWELLDLVAEKIESGVWK